MQSQQHKRPSGTGSLRVRKDAAGRETWYGQWRVGDRLVKRALGAKRVPGTRHGLTRPQAEAKLRELRATAQPAADERLTVAEAGTRLLRHLEAMGRKRSTTEAYESALRVHLAPWFREKPLDRITRADVEALMAAKRAEGLSVKSVANYIGFLHSIFDYGVRQRWLTENPVKHVEKPRAEGGDADIRFITMDELEALLRVVPDDDLGRVERVMYLAAATTGMRQGEAIALRWQDVDWAAKRIRVRRSYVRGEFGTPKSKRSSRAVPMTDRLAGELDKLSLTSSYTADAALVFGHPHTGSPLDRSKLLKRFKAAMKAAGMAHRLGEGGITFHSLRHSFATAMAAQGVPMRALQELLGHRDFATTLIYADYSPSAQEADWAEAAFALANRAPETAKLSLELGQQVRVES